MTPQSRTHAQPAPRLRYQRQQHAGRALPVHTQVELDKEGVGNFNLASTAYNQKSSENTLQVTETAMLNPRSHQRNALSVHAFDSIEHGDNTMPALNVQGAFTGGGPQIGNSGNTANHAEVTNTTTMTHGTHTIKWGGRFRQSFNNDTSVNNFGGTFTFFGGLGPELDANNQPIPGTSIAAHGARALPPHAAVPEGGSARLRRSAAGGGASQFTLSAGTPTTSVNQFDAGLFVNDDWRMRPNLTFSYGLRYETQTNISDHGNFAPRVGLAWGVDCHGGKAGQDGAARRLRNLLTTASTIT